MEPALNLLAADDLNVRRRYLDDVDRINIDDTMVLLSPIERATRLLSASSYPTHGDHIVADAIYQKLSNYWPIMSESSQISSLLDPRVKFSAFEDEIEKTNAKNLILNLAGYAFLLSPLPAETTPGNDIIETRSFFRNLRNNTVTLNSLENTNSSASRTLDNEMERLDAETARVTLCLKSWIREAVC
ncbi:unnamed protein product [Rhizophagus irregularis]|nr:unnamed protein product [Rhizophagus irregularis]